MILREGEYNGVVSDDPTSTPLLTVEQVKQWLEERADLAARIEFLNAKLGEADRRLEGLAQVLPPETFARIVGRSASLNSVREQKDVTSTTARMFRKAHDGSSAVTEVCVTVLAQENGGRTAVWMREKLLEMPDQMGKVRRSPHSVSESLKRLVERNLVIKRGDFFYHPDVLRRIEDGTLEEERVGNAKAKPFTSEMARVFEEMGGVGVARDVLLAARGDASVGPQIDRQGNKVYRWLTKQVAREQLAKDGDVYRLPSLRDGALNGQATSAPSAGEVAPSPIENRTGLFDQDG